MRFGHKIARGQYGRMRRKSSQKGRRLTSSIAACVFLDIFACGGNFVRRTCSFTLFLSMMRLILIDTTLWVRLVFIE